MLIFSETTSDKELLACDQIILRSSKSVDLKSNAAMLFEFVSIGCECTIAFSLFASVGDITMVLFGSVF